MCSRVGSAARARKFYIVYTSLGLARQAWIYQLGLENHKGSSKSGDLDMIAPQKTPSIHVHTFDYLISALHLQLYIYTLTKTHNMPLGSAEPNNVVNPIYLHSSSREPMTDTLGDPPATSLYPSALAFFLFLRQIAIQHARNAIMVIGVIAARATRLCQISLAPKSLA